MAAKMKINLADLKNNSEAVKNLMSIVKSKAEPEVVAAPKAEKKKKKKKKAKKPHSSIIVVETPTEEEKPKEVRAHYDDDSLAKNSAIRTLLNTAQGYFDQRQPAYGPMSVLFSSAYRYSELKNRILLSSARILCNDAVALLAQKEKVRAKLKKARKSPSEIRQALQEYSTKHIQISLQEIFSEVAKNLDAEDQKRAGTSYDTLNSSYHVDLSTADSQAAVVVLARADIMITALRRIDLADAAKHAHLTETIHVEETIYAIKNALLIGCFTHALPKKINDDSLSAMLAREFNMHGRPVAQQMRHPTSSRTWFFIPEYNKIFPRTVQFADRSLTSEFDTFRSLSNNPTEEDIRFIFMRIGVTNDQIKEVLKRWRACDTNRGRLAILHNEYQAVKRQIKNQRLRALRENFLTDNASTIDAIRKMEDRVVQIREEKTSISTKFSELASNTGKAEHGLRIGQYRRIDEAFEQIESLAVRNNPDSYDRRRIRNDIRNDRIKCRELRFETSELKVESRSMTIAIKHSKRELEVRRENAFRELIGS